MLKQPEVSIHRGSPQNLVCPSCGRDCQSDDSWYGANLCRGLALLKVIEGEPGLTGWKLSQQCGMAYKDTTRALAKLREQHVVLTEQEDRPEGGIRYRFWASENSTLRQRFVEVVRRAESLA